MATIKAPFLRTQYNYDRDEVSTNTGLECKDPTLAQQQFKDECDINILFGKYLETGEIPQVQDVLEYGDFTGVFDFQTAMNAVRTAEGMFETLPARVKNRFDNDPQKLLHFLNDPENREEAQFLGLVAKPELVNKGDENAPRPQSTPAKQTETGPRPGGTEESTQAPAPAQKP